jgi:Dolichyl-phosphate-mannose-protein mannosyltransferase
VPHLLMVPFIWIDPLWHTGLAGSLVGLACLTVTAVALFASLRLLVRHKAAAWVGVAILLTNPNVLYVHTTALTEPVLLMAMTASANCLLRWARTRRTPALMAAGALAMLGIGSRYDGWFFAVASAGIVLLIVLVQSRNVHAAEGLTLAYVVLPVFAMFLWVYYNWLIWGDPLEFLHGQFSAQFQQTQIAAAGGLRTQGNLGLSAVTYSLATLHNTGIVMLGIALVGLLAYTLRLRTDGGFLAPYVFLAAYPFNILALYVGQTIITLPESEPPGFFNVRYGLMLAPGVALFAALAFDRLARLPRGPWLGAVGVALLAQMALYVPGWPLSTITIADGVVGSSARPPRSAASAYLAEHYRGGGVLADDSDFSESQVLFEAGIPMHEYIATFSGPLWQQALVDPGSQVEWLVMHTRTRDDRVASVLLGSRVVDQEFSLEFEDAVRGQGVYHRRPAG